MGPKALESSDTVDAPTTAQSAVKGSRGSSPWICHAIREIQAGRDPNHEQFGLIFRHYEPRCHQLLRALGLRRDLDDLVQKVMWRVYRGIPKFRLESSFDTWFNRIVKNFAMNAFRDRSTQSAKAEMSLDTLLDPGRDGESSFPEPGTHDPDPLEVTLGKEREAELDALLEILPHRMRQSMLLFYIHGYQQAEIAKLQGTSVNTVKKQLGDGRKRIRPLFGVFAELFSLLVVVLLLVA